MTDELNAICAEVDEAWRHRDDPEGLTEFETLLDRRLPGALFERQWRNARLEHFRAMQHLEAGRADDARREFQSAATWGRAAIASELNRVEGRFWFASCALEAARAKGGLAPAMALSNAQKHLEAAVKIDEAFHFAGPLRVLGRVTHLKPLLLGGSLDSAIAFYTRARQLYSGNSTTMLYLAEALRADRQPGEAKRVLRELVSAPDDLDWKWEQTRDRKLAAKLLDEMD